MPKKSGTTDAPAADAGQVATTTDQPAANDAATGDAATATAPATAATEESADEVEVTISAEGADLSTLFTSFVEAQDHFRTPRRSKTAEVKDANNKVIYSYKYADLDEIVKAIRPALRAHKLGFYQLVSTDQAKVTVRTVLVHGPTGMKLESDALSLMAQSAKAQHIGGAITYARRYSLATFMGVAAEDDSDAMEEMNTGGRRQVHVPDDEQIPAQGRARNSAAQAPARQQTQGGSAPYKGEKDTRPGAAATGGTKPRTKIGKGDQAHYDGCITVKQIKRMFGVAGEHGVTAEQLRDFLADGGIKASEDIPVDRYDGIISAIEAGHVNVK